MRTALGHVCAIQRVVQRSRSGSGNSSRKENRQKASRSASTNDRGPTAIGRNSGTIKPS